MTDEKLLEAYGGAGNLNGLRNVIKADRAGTKVAFEIMQAIGFHMRTEGEYPTELRMNQEYFDDYKSIPATLLKYMPVRVVLDTTLKNFAVGVPE